MTIRTTVAAARRIVLKAGTRVLTDESGLPALSRLFGLVEVAAAQRRAGRDVLIVTSGAVGLGREALGWEGRDLDLPEKQACASVGQARLMSLYDAGFARLGVTCGQVLLSQGDFDDRTRYLNLRATLETLLSRGVVPVLNENDAVSTEELALVDGPGAPVFGDNDRLSALVASKLDADLLVLLTNVPGLYDRDPRADAEATLIAEVEPARVLEAAGGASPGGRGGMRSKVEAARLAAQSGCDAVIASGLLPDALGAVLRGEPEGTFFPAVERPAARRRWIAFAAATRGVLHLDTGAVSALREQGASLLPRGVRRIDGAFRKGDVVELRDPDGGLVARGVAHVDAEAARRWLAGEAPGGARNHHALVHRDQLALLG